MEMASRIRRSWESLAGHLAGKDAGDRAFVDALRDWLRRGPAAVSSKAAAALRQARGVELVLRGDPAELPISSHAAIQFATALHEAPPKDPGAYVTFVDSLCWSLAVFRRDDDCCSVCQGELELWTDGTTCFEVCTLLGCCFDPNGTRITVSPADLRPARRSDVLQRYAQAPLVPVQRAT